MTNSTPPSTKAHQLYRALAAPAFTSTTPAAQAWLAHREQDIAEDLQSLQDHWSLRHEGALRWGGAALVALLPQAWLVNAFSSVGSIANDMELLTLVVLGLLAFFMVGVWAMDLIGLPLLQAERYRRMWLLESASAEPLLCAQALSCVEQCEQAKTWRDQVVGAERALRVLDLHVLLELGRRAKLQAAEAERRATCQRLHGVAPAAG